MIKLIIAIVLIVICYFAYILTDKFKNVSEKEPYNQYVGKSFILKTEIRLVKNPGVFSLTGIRYNRYLKRTVPLNVSENLIGDVIKTGQEVKVIDAVVLRKAVSGAKYSYLLCSVLNDQKHKILFALEFGESFETWGDKGLATKFKFDDDLPW